MNSLHIGQRTRALALLALLPLVPTEASAAAPQWTTDTMSSPAVGRSTSPGAVAVSNELVVPGYGFVTHLDLSTGTWVTDTTVPMERDVASTSVGDVALFAGGRPANNTGSTTDLVRAYDAGAGVWSTMSLSSARWALATASAGSKSFFAGGGGPSPLVAFDVVDIFDHLTGTWTVASLSSARIGPTGASVGTKVLFAGGWSAADGFSDTVDIHDTATGSWTTASLSVPRQAIAATTVGHLVFFAGGIAAGGDGLTVVDIYDDRTGTWSVASLSVGRYVVGATSVGTKALFAGGLLANPFGTTSYLVSGVVDVYDASTGLWTVDSLSAPREGVLAASVGPRAYFAGGYADVPPFAFDAVDVHDDGIGTRYCSPAVPTSTGAPAELHVLGFPGLASQPSVVLQARRLPADVFGIFAVSPAQGLAGGVGGGQGTLCLGSPLGRFVQSGEILNSGPDGAFELVVDLSRVPQPTQFVAVQSGESWNFQAWFRDRNPGPTSNLTDAVSVTFP